MIKKIGHDLMMQHFYALSPFRAFRDLLFQKPSSKPLLEELSKTCLLLLLLLLLSRFSRVRLCVDPRDSSPPGFPVPGILQARTLEWVANSFSKTCLHFDYLQRSILNILSRSFHTSLKQNRKVGVQSMELSWRLEP